jgi:nitrous oxide reductase accessory protein NosL
MILYCRKHAYLIGKLTGLILATSLVLSGTMQGANSAERFSIEHPFRNPEKYTDHERCDNCGMDRNKWARTRHEFKTTKGTFYTCAIACVAVMGLKIKEEALDVKVAEYLSPMKMLDADKAFYVMGSTAPGTMTSVSKIAFSNKKEAVAFSAKYGGQVVRFQDALAAARKEALGER